MSKALPLSHGGIRLVRDKSAKQFPNSKMLLLNIGQELTYHSNGCQNAKDGYILYTNRGNKEKKHAFLMYLCICM